LVRIMAQAPRDSGWIMAVALIAACATGDDATARDTAAVTLDTVAAPTAVAGTFPIVGIAPVAIVFAGDSAAAWYATLGGSRERQCHAEFGQPRWDGYQAYDLTLADSSGRGHASGVGLAVVSAARWSRDTDGRVVADLDGDRRAEEARRCTAGEGEHFTVWSTAPDGQRTRRAHEYFDWGAFTEPRCAPGEDGRDAADDSAPAAAP
jgi:hypothetical protein